MIEDNAVHNAEKRLREINARMEKACARVGRNAAEVTLIGAGKSVESARLCNWYASGLRDLGENYVQEATRKQDEIALFNATSSTRCEFRWHFIGALQSNKAREVVGKFSLIHSVDRTRLAQALNHEATRHNLVQDVLLQVNIGDESSKSGCQVDELGELFGACATLPNLNVRGLMCLPPFCDDAEKTRVHFRRLRLLRDQLRGEFSTSSTRIGHLELSMGMSNDFEIAIEEGATMVRIGTALFGARG